VACGIQRRSFARQRLDLGTIVNLQSGRAAVMDSGLVIMGLEVDLTARGPAGRRFESFHME